MDLPSPKTKKKSKRKGRGYASGVGGHTVGKGQKGQLSRSGYKKPRPGFEGGRMPLSRRIPKLPGFRRGYFKSKYIRIELGLDDLDALYKDGEKVNFDTLIEKGVKMSKTKDVKVKILANGEISKKLIVEGIKTSETAQKKIEAAGGKVEI
ncbi:50S ribosomal protein L15 [Candidatus Dojkabacteria bacterium]|nr:50S ribosomal protein L15 [Candidatus Dojkabacteria bacterium]